MRILVVSPFYSPGIGGAPRLIQGFVHYLVHHGHDVEVLTFGEPLYKNCAAFDQAQPYPIHRVPAHYQTAKTAARLGLRMSQLLLRRRYDAVFCGSAYPTVILGYIGHKLFRVPYSVYSHGEDIAWVKDGRRKLAALTRALSGARAVMANSRFTQREIEAIGVPPAQVERITPGIDPEPYLTASSERVEALRRQLGLEGKRIVLTVARLIPRKGQDTVVRLLPRLVESVPNLHYLVVGHGDPSFLQQLALEAGVADRVTLLSDVDDADLPLLYNLCDLYIMVSRFDPTTNEVEGFGIVYLEAGACGKPAIAGSAGGAADAVLDQVTGLVVDPTDPAQIEAALRELLIDQARARQMGEHARQRVIAEFHNDVLHARMERAVLSLPRPAVYQPSHTQG